jgi:hypothetical protein
MSITSQPVRIFPAMASHGNPAAVPSSSAHTCARALARARAIRSSMAGPPARSRARRTVGPLGASPSTGARCASTAISLMLVAPSAIAAATETRTTPRSRTGDIPVFRSAAPRPAVSPAWSAILRSSTAPACPTRPAPPPATFRAWSHRVSSMAKSAPVSGKLLRCGDLQSPRTRALFALKTSKEGRSAAVRIPARADRPAPIRCMRYPAHLAAKPQLTATSKPPDRSTADKR